MMVFRKALLPTSLLPTLLLGAAALLSGCLATGGAPADLARYDFVPGAQTVGSVLALRGVDVIAPSWLAGPAMQYRLNFADDGRREAYATSRWVAPPAELLENSLRQRLVAGTRRSVTADCRLRVELDEFVQVFDQPQESRAVVNLRLALLPGRGELVLARRSLALSKPAGAEARSGAAALSSLAGELGGTVEQWLQQLAGDDAQLGERCRGTATTG
jgi:cholesterol transport system auxiliary component